MTVKFEYYITNDDTADGLGGTSWDCQTFTPLTTHRITMIKLKLFRNKQTPYVTVGTITVGIRATDSGKPIGDDLCSGTVDGDSLTIDTDGEWAEITLEVGYTLIVDTKYAIVIRAPDATSDGDAFYWRTDEGSPTYTRGNNEFSDDSGATWTTYTDYDMMFEEWGVLDSVYHLGTKTIPKYLMTTSVKGGG